LQLLVPVSYCIEIPSRYHANPAFIFQCSLKKNNNNKINKNSACSVNLTVLSYIKAIPLIC